MRPNVNWNIGVAPERKSTYTSKILKAGIPFSSQVTEPDTKYIIKYDFDLGGESVEIPERCILEFDGGSLRNGTLVGQGTGIESAAYGIFGDNLYITGMWNVPEIYVDWFAISESEGYDNTPIIANAFNMANDGSFNTIIFPSKTLYVSEHTQYEPEEKLYLFYVSSNTKVIMDANLILNTCDKPHYEIFKILDKENVTITGSGSITGDVETHIHNPAVHNGELGQWGHGIVGSGRNILISNITISKCWGDGIRIGEYFCDSDNIKIQNVTLDSNRRQGITVDCVNNSEICYCDIKNTGTIRGTSPKAGIDYETYIPTQTSESELLTFSNHYTHHNRFTNNAGHDILVAGDGTDPQSLFCNMMICDNIYSNGRVDIYGCKDAIIRNETLIRVKLGITGDNHGGKANTVGTCDVEVSDCKVNSVLVADNRTDKIKDITFKNCVFVYDPNVVNQRGNAGIIQLNSSFHDTWKGSFYNCKFFVITGNPDSLINISQPKLESVEKFIDCDFLADCRLQFYGVDTFEGCYFKCQKVFVIAYMSDMNATISNNVFDTVVGSPISILGSSDAEVNADSKISIFNNTNIGNSYGIVEIPSDEGAEYIVNLVFYIFNNLAVRGLFSPSDINKSSQSITINEYNNRQITGKSASPGAAEPYVSDTGELEVFSGSAWCRPDGSKSSAKNKGLKSQRPSGSDIYVGFQYMQVDTTYGTYPIWASSISGATVTWVKADGTSAD